MLKRLMLITLLIAQTNLSFGASCLKSFQKWCCCSKSATNATPPTARIEDSGFPTSPVSTRVVVSPASVASPQASYLDTARATVGSPLEAQRQVHAAAQNAALHGAVSAVAADEFTQIHVLHSYEQAMDSSSAAAAIAERQALAKLREAEVFAAAARRTARDLDKYEV